MDKFEFIGPKCPAYKSENFKVARDAFFRLSVEESCVPGCLTEVVETETGQGFARKKAEGLELLKLPHSSLNIMSNSTLLYGQLMGYLRQHSRYRDLRHLKALSWMVSAPTKELDKIGQPSSPRDYATHEQLKNRAVQFCPTITSPWFVVVNST